MQSDGTKCTALHFAYESGNKKIVSMLLKKGAQVCVWTEQRQGILFSALTTTSVVGCSLRKTAKRKAEKH
jgi:ankyrin repeat protein